MNIAQFKTLAQSVKVLRIHNSTLFQWRNPMGINKAWGTFSVTVFCREVAFFTFFLTNSLCTNTLEMINDLKQSLCFVDLVNFKHFT